MSKLINNTLRLNKLSGVIEFTEEEYKIILDEAEMINKNSKLPVDLLNDSEEDDNMPEDKLLYLIKNGTSYTYNYKGYSLTYTMMTVSNDKDKFLLTEVDFQNNSFDIIGIKVGMKFEDAQTILKYMGYIAAGIMNISIRKLILIYKRNTGQSIITLNINKGIINRVRVTI